MRDQISTVTPNSLIKMDSAPAIPMPMETPSLQKAVSWATPQLVVGNMLAVSTLSRLNELIQGSVDDVQALGDATNAMSVLSEPFLNSSPAPVVVASKAH